MLPRYTTAIYEGEPTDEITCQWVSIDEKGALVTEDEADYAPYSQTITVIIDDLLE